jgi:hypothetical protein
MLLSRRFERAEPIKDFVASRLNEFETQSATSFHCRNFDWKYPNGFAHWLRQGARECAVMNGRVAITAELTSVTDDLSES